MLQATLGSDTRRMNDSQRTV